jgi:hypothetical protein
MRGGVGIVRAATLFIGTAMETERPLRTRAAAARMRSGVM